LFTCVECYMDGAARTVYSLDDVSGDTSFNNFNINNVPAAVFSVIKDILTVNPALKVRESSWVSHDPILK
jgi:hypothetical protein